MEYHIVVDDRERVIAKILHRKDVIVDIRRIEVGDFIISKRVVVERKTISDFVNSIIDRRIFKQIENMKEFYERPIIILEGIEDIYSVRNVHPNAIRGAIASISVDYGIPIIRTSNAEETAEMLIAIARREQSEKKEISLHKKKPMTKAEIQVYVVSSLPMIGPNTAKRLLEYFGTIENVFTANVDELMKVEGIGKEKAKKMRELITSRYEP